MGYDQAPPVMLLGIGTAVPPHILPQDMVRTTAKNILGKKFPDFERLAKSFESSGIEKRYSVAPFEWFKSPKDWPERTKVYLDEATKLFVAAAQNALSECGLSARDVDTIVTVSSTGIATPTLEARALKDLDFRPDVKRVPVFGLGCAGGVSGLSLAARLAAAEPGTNVLVVAVETCTLSFRSDRLRKADIIATVLFGDGAAAACLRAGEGDGIIVEDTLEYTWSDTLPIMGWDVDDDGFGVIFDRSIPNFIKTHFIEAKNAAFKKFNRVKEDYSRFVYHPGGAKVVTAIEETMEFSEGSLNFERDVLRDYGNMSAPTALFVLNKVLETGQKGAMLLSALGPGFTASMVSLKSV